MPAGYSGTPLAKKLGIRPGQRVLLVNAPVKFEETLDALPDDAIVTRSRAGTQEFGTIMLFCARAADMTTHLNPLIARLALDGGLWICWPKKSSGIQTDATEARVRAEGLATRLVDIKVCAVDETWSGLRFVRRVADRPKVKAGAKQAKKTPRKARPSGK